MLVWVADECNRVLGQELTEAGEREHANLARKAKERELGAWGRFKVFLTGENGSAV